MSMTETGLVLTPRRDPLNALSVARSHLVEQIMALKGRGSKDPVRYRRILEGMEFATLQRNWQQMLETPSSAFAELS